ncbi:E3 ubiquitin-protein ligase BOI-like,Zinc finger, RING-type [Cinara cedri]|uniref:E3 ubiquitin-protein ligase BOI-like,Zinc finger, RING-type n=1 Tax=Cinara cedri TaxID=506608 RepID=A0A5E4NPJ0_9HEMI|nr:E3 ubiquitin-protein ligase BOI-like,Zinc finger, RING-type [Cinara cedri]
MAFFSLFYKNNKASSSTSNRSNLLSKMINQDSILQEKLEKLEKQKDLRKLNLLEEEKNFKKYEENKIRQHQNRNTNYKRIQFLITDEETTNQLVSSIQKENLQKHEQLLHHLIEIENASYKIINDTLNFNRSFKMDYDEKYIKCNSIKCDQLNLRNKDNDYTLKLEQLIEEANLQRCVLVNNASNCDSSKMEKLTDLLNTSNCYRQVLKEHLKNMYNQLKYLTVAEVQRKNLQLNKQINNLSNERITLTQMLVDFIDKKNQSQKRLIQELEAQNVEFETATKWLSQYSNLVNDMPSELKFYENTVNPTLLHRVCSAGGSHLLLFILENELKLPLTKEYLTNMGVNSCEDQEILINSLNNLPAPSAPHENEFTPTAPFLDELECIVCMEARFDVLFIPCGHLCCCSKCSQKITVCPMCRTHILNNLNIKNIT